MFRIKFYIGILTGAILSVAISASAEPATSWRSANLTATEIQWLEQHPKLRLGIDRSFSPYEWIDQDGTYTGIAADYIALLEQRLGIEIVPVTDKTSWQEVLKAAESGEFDLMSCLVKTDQRETFLQFSEPYLSSTAVIISEQSRGYIGTLDKLTGMKIAIHKGHFTNELLRRDHPQLHIINPPTIDAALALVAEGKADAFVGDATAASYVMKREGFLNLSFSGHTQYRSEFRMAVPLHHPVLAGIITKALNSITEEERNAIYDHWSGLVVPHGISLETLLKWAAVAVVLLLSFSYWNYRLQHSQAAHRASEQRFRNLVHTTNGIVWEANPVTNTVTYITDNVERLLGYPASDWQAQGFWLNHVHPEDREQTRADYWEQAKKLNDFESSYRFINAQGDTVWIRDIVSVVSEDGAAKLLRGLMLDITEQKKAEMLILKSEGRFRELIESLPAIAVQGYDENLKTIYWNEASSDLYGYSRSDAIGKSLLDLIIPDNLKEEVLEHHRQWLEKGIPIPASELELQHRDGHLIPVYSSHVMLGSGTTGKEMYCIDISLAEQKRVNAELTQLAQYDPLTQLPNRRTSSDRLDQMMKRADRSGHKVAVMMIDLDHFKEVNDTLGHDQGDRVLQQATARLETCIRETDTVARLGGDEFLIILESASEISAIERVARTILQKMSEPFTLNETLSYLSASIGITFYPDDATNKDALLKNADQAMYAAKQRGRNRFHYFTREMQEFAQHRRNMLNDLRCAISREQLEIHYQPIVDLDTAEIHKAEALLRWNHPSGQIPPADFIPLAEEAGLISEIGDWVFAEVSRQSASWRHQYQRDIQLSVNTSSAQYRNEHYCGEQWFKDMAEQGMKAASLCVEITESLLLEPDESALKKLLTLRDKGIEVSLDDFGTGYCSLAYLKQFHIDYLKIDRSFIQNIQPHNSDLVLCEAMIVMAHTLGIKVIAEGVETEQQRQLLLDMGCDFAQGYFYSRPLSAERFAERWLALELHNSD